MDPATAMVRALNGGADYDPTGLIGPTQPPGQPSVLDYAKEMIPGTGHGIYGMLQTAGVQTPPWMNMVAALANNRDLNDAIGALRLARLNPAFAGGAYHVVNDENNIVAHALMNKEPGTKNVHVGWIGAGPWSQPDAEAAASAYWQPNVLGTREMLSLLPQVGREFPGAQYLTGERISGARAASEASPNMRIKIPQARAK